MTLESETCSASAEFRDGGEVPQDCGQSTLDRIAEVVEQRMLIEQAKGVLRFVYQLDDQRAFDLLVWRSQVTNTKLRDLAAALCEKLDTVAPSSDTRARFDQLLSTIHEGVASTGIDAGV
ncbi:ANTAR domain-containing protein [Gordonia sp. CPCC 205333]|uniref:ANTAR domain-containing protein n=1 Tax=Gordonia sp. CPCC 205333 TaxID=3140790 RepID=UPI003AF3DC04